MAEPLQRIAFSDAPNDVAIFGAGGSTSVTASRAARLRVLQSSDILEDRQLDGVAQGRITRRTRMDGSPASEDS